MCSCTTRTHNTCKDQHRLPTIDSDHTIVSAIQLSLPAAVAAAVHPTAPRTLTFCLCSVCAHSAQAVHTAGSLEVCVCNACVTVSHRSTRNFTPSLASPTVRLTHARVQLCCACSPSHPSGRTIHFGIARLHVGVSWLVCSLRVVSWIVGEAFCVCCCMQFAHELLRGVGRSDTGELYDSGTVWTKHRAQHIAQLHVHTVHTAFTVFHSPSAHAHNWHNGTAATSKRCDDAGCTLECTQTA